ncbi:hypothetical protein C8Q74DRAFT_895926 [Fomes fomentarius]|nr:hypothetical protein C8Q74DRAFT_895926 [Fomes fomentarius]
MANDPAQPQVPKEYLLRIAPVLVGSWLSCLLFGISVVQLYIYYTSYPNDRRGIRLSVYGIFLLDILQTIVSADSAWDTLCSGWGRPINIQFPDWSYYALPMISGTAAAWVQLFYAWRIYQLSQWRVIPFIIAFFSLAQTGAACAITVSFAILKNIERLHDPNMYARTIIWLGGGAFVDVTIMLSMVYLLYSAKRQTISFRRGELMVNRLLRMTIETGSACALCATLELAFFLGMPHTHMHLIFALMLSKVYSNTLMASLNARIRTSEKLKEPRSLSSLSFNNFPMLPSIGEGPQLTLPARVSREQAHLNKSVKDKVAKSWNVELNDMDSDDPAKQSLSHDGLRLGITPEPVEPHQ